MCACSVSKLCQPLTPWTVDHQAPLSLRFSRQEDWSALPFPPPGDLPDPGTQSVSLASPALTGRFKWEAHNGAQHLPSVSYKQIPVQIPMCKKMGHSYYWSFLVRYSLWQRKGDGGDSCFPINRECGTPRKGDIELSEVRGQCVGRENKHLFYQYAILLAYLCQFKKKAYMQPCENKIAERKHVYIYLKYKYTNNNTPSKYILKKTNRNSYYRKLLFLEVTSNSFHCNLAHTQSPTTKFYTESRAPFLKIFLHLFLAVSNLSCVMCASLYCGVWVQLPHGMWDVSSLTRIEPVSPVLEGGLSTTGPPRSPKVTC